MSQKIFLTSALAMGFVAPAMAEPTNTGTFPSDGYMQEDYTYTNAATADNMDTVYEGTVNANAEYTDILYNIVAGNYLEAGSDATNGTQCPANSYCPGLTNAKYNETDDQGINSCPNEYGLSAAGASSQNDCYRTCTTADVAHSAGVTGGYYYGNNNQCGATSCVNGWHLKTSMSGSELATAIGTGEGENSAYINNSGSFSQQTFGGTDRDQAFYGLTDNNTWAVYYDSTHGMLTGQARCSTRGVANIWYQNNNTFESDHFVGSLADETGQEGAQYCYCNVTGYTPDGGALQSLSSPWVFSYDGGSASTCAHNCALSCALSMRDTYSADLAFRAAVLGSVGASPAMCEANTITINWNGTTQAAIDANNAGVATYGEDVRTPVSATPVKGKTFRGWRFSKPEQVSTDN